MTTLHVIILAQGQQSRLPDLLVPKQLLEIPHAGETILKRTFRLLGELAPSAFITLVGHRGLAEAVGGAVHPTVTGFANADLRSFYVRTLPGVMSAATLLTLHHPGNHAVAGLQQVVRSDVSSVHYHSIVVALGDVIYSRAALRELLFGTPPGADPSFDGIAFVGTPSLTGGGGELFGIRVPAARRDVLLAEISKTSIAFTDYQPGRLRELLWELQKRSRISWDLRVHAKAPYIPITDFTTDIDTPADVANLPELGKLVAAEGIP
jgi:hypothetical protein